MNVVSWVRLQPIRTKLAATTTYLSMGPAQESTNDAAELLAKVTCTELILDRFY